MKILKLFLCLFAMGSALQAAGDLDAKYRALYNEKEVLPLVEKSLFDLAFPNPGHLFGDEYREAVIENIELFKDFKKALGSDENVRTKLIEECGKIIKHLSDRQKFIKDVTSAEKLMLEMKKCESSCYQDKMAEHFGVGTFQFYQPQFQEYQDKLVEKEVSAQLKFAPLDMRARAAFICQKGIPFGDVLSEADARDMAKIIAYDTKMRLAIEAHFAQKPQVEKEAFDNEFLVVSARFEFEYHKMLIEGVKELAAEYQVDVTNLNAVAVSDDIEQLVFGDKSARSSSSSWIPDVIRNNPLITGVAGGTALVGLACGKIYYDYTQQKPVDTRGNVVPFKTYLYNELTTFDFSKVSTWLKVVGIGTAVAGAGASIYRATQG